MPFSPLFGFPNEFLETERFITMSVTSSQTQTRRILFVCSTIAAFAFGVLVGPGAFGAPPLPDCSDFVTNNCVSDDQATEYVLLGDKIYLYLSLDY